MSAFRFRRIPTTYFSQKFEMTLLFILVKQFVPRGSSTMQFYNITKADCEVMIVSRGRGLFMCQCFNIKRYNYYAIKFWHDKFIFEIHAQTPREVIYVTRFTMRFSMYLMNQSFYLPTQCKKRSVVVSDTNFCYLICLQITNKIKWILGWLIYCP